MPKPIDRLMQRDMTRKEFLSTLGLGIVAILGFGRVVEMLSGHSINKNISNRSSLGYSNGDYGGGSDSSSTKPSTTSTKRSV